MGLARSVSLLLLAVLVHSAYGASLFIKPPGIGGVDTGDCTDQANACATLDYALTQTSASGMNQIIVETGTYVFPASPTPLVTSNLLDGRTITIEGATKGACIFQSTGTDGASLFQWNAPAAWTSATIAFKKITFSGGQTQSNSHLLRLSDTNANSVSFGTLLFEDCAFESMNLDHTSPGLVSVDSGANVALTLTNVVFELIRPVTIGGVGGALHWGSVATTSTLVINGPGSTVASPTSLFKSNRGQYGAAISFSGTWGAQVRIDDTIFEANRADFAGGAISTIASLGNSANKLRLYGCAFKDNVQGAPGTADVNNLGGGALAISQGEVQVLGSGTTAHPCAFTGNSLAVEAATDSAARGGSAIRVTATNVDGDAPPVTGFSVERCTFSQNSGTLRRCVGAPLFVYGTLSEVTAMAVKPTFLENVFVDNLVLDDSVSAGLQYTVPGGTAETAGVLRGGTFSSPSPRFDIVLDGALQVANSSVADAFTTVGRLKLTGTSSLFVQPNGRLDLKPLSRSESVSLSATSTVNNAGLMRFSELSDVSAQGTLNSPGTLYVSRATSVGTVGLTGTSTLQFGVRSAADYGILSASNGLVLAGSIVGLSEDGFSPAEPLALEVITADPISGEFGSSSCVGLPGTCSARVENGKVVLVDSPSSSVPVGAIVGGIVGGVLLLALIFLIAVLVARKKKNAKSNVNLPNPAFDPTRDGERPISPKKRVQGGAKAQRIRSESISGDPSVDASLHRIAATSDQRNSTPDVVQENDDFGHL